MNCRFCHKPIGLCTCESDTYTSKGQLIRVICGTILRFKTLQHKKHICVLTAPHQGEKHECKCGVKWTQDPELASKGKEWSHEQVIFQGDRFGEKPGGLLLDPTKNYNDNDDEES